MTQEEKIKENEIYEIISACDDESYCYHCDNCISTISAVKASEKIIKWHTTEVNRKMEEELKLWDTVTQFINDKDGKSYELCIHKNDPKNGGRDYWCCWYQGSTVSLSDYYNLNEMLRDLTKEVKKKGYYFYE